MLNNTTNPLNADRTWRILNVFICLSGNPGRLICMYLPNLAMVWCTQRPRTRNLIATTIVGFFAGSIDERIDQVEIDRERE
jgi:hypothetical protein